LRRATRVTRAAGVHPTTCGSSEMRYLWQVVARTMRRVWGRAVGAPPEQKRSDETLRVASRARFWADFREGQREAAARTTRP
jgi:hypothetical protein